jgi:uncharacterized lipoprotein YmbA
MDQLVGIPNKVEVYVQQAIETSLEDLDMDSEVAQAILTYFETHDMSEIIGTAVTDAIANLRLQYDSTDNITTYKGNEIATVDQLSTDDTALSTRVTALETKTQDVSYDDQTEFTKTVQFNGSIDLGAG